MQSKWLELTEEEKIKFKNYCDNKFGINKCFCETGEPMYFDRKMNLLDNNLIIDMIVKINKN